MILVTGATGQLGGAVIKQLLTKTSSSNIVAFARDIEKASTLVDQGIEVRIGTFDDVASLDKAMVGIEKVLIISTVDQNRFEQHKNVVDAAVKAGVNRVFYTGVAMENERTSVIRELMESHAQTDEYIRASGLKYTLLHNSLYMDVIPMFVGEGVLNTGVILPAGEGRVPFVLRREIGEAAANALLEDRPENVEYDIAHSSMYSFADVAQALSELSGKEVPYINAEREAFEAQLKSFGVPDFAVWMTSGFATDIKNHQYEQRKADVGHLLGRTPTDLKLGLKELFGL